MTLNYEKEAKRALLHYFKVVKPDLDTDCYAEIQLIVHNIIRAAAQEAKELLEHHLDQDHPQWTCPSCGSLNKMGFHFCQFCRKLDEKHEELVWAAEYDANIDQWTKDEVADRIAKLMDDASVGNISQPDAVSEIMGFLENLAQPAPPQPEVEEAHLEGKVAHDYDEWVAQWEANMAEDQAETASFEDTAGMILHWLVDMYNHYDAWEGGNEAQLLVETAIEKLNDAHELYTPQPEEPEPTPPINPFRHLNNKQLIDIIRNIPEGGGLGAEAKAIIQQEWAMTRDLVAAHLARCQFSHMVEFIGLAARHMEFDIYNFRSRLAEILDLVEELKGLQPDGTCWGDIVTAEKKQEAEWKKQNRMMDYYMMHY